MKSNESWNWCHIDWPAYLVRIIKNCQSKCRRWRECPAWIFEYLWIATFVPAHRPPPMVLAHPNVLCSVDCSWQNHYRIGCNCRSMLRKWWLDANRRHTFSYILWIGPDRKDELIEMWKCARSITALELVLSLTLAGDTESITPQQQSVSQSVAAIALTRASLADDLKKKRRRNKWEERAQREAVKSSMSCYIVCETMTASGESYQRGQCIVAWVIFENFEIEQSDLSICIVWVGSVRANFFAGPHAEIINKLEPVSWIWRSLVRCLCLRMLSGLALNLNFVDIDLLVWKE